MGEEKVIAAFEKNCSEVVKVVLQRWRSAQYVDIRIWATPRPGDPPGLHPTKVGLTLSVELLPELRSAIDKALEEVQR